MLVMRWNGEGLPRFVAGIEKLNGRNTNDAFRRALNHTGDKARTIVKRTLAKQAGVTQSDLIKYGALTVRRANYGRLEYEISSRGGYLPLKAFKARQTKKGVTAAPWNTRRLFQSTFIVKSLGGHVFKRTSKVRLPIEKLWGPAIPKEMIKNPTAAAWQTVAASLPDRIAHEVKVITNGVVS